MGAAAALPLEFAQEGGLTVMEPAMRCTPTDTDLALLRRTFDLAGHAAARGIQSLLLSVPSLVCVVCLG